MKKALTFIFVLAVIIYGSIYFLKNRDIKEKPIGGDRDTKGCLVSAGYAFSEEVQACIRAFEMTPDIKNAAKLAIDYVGPDYALTVTSFNSYEEAGSYDIFLEKGTKRIKQTIYIRAGKIQDSEIGVRCHESPKYFVIERSKVDSVGSDILVKYKSSPAQSMRCAYDIEAGDFELKNLEAVYFLAFTDNFLVLDSGTAPPPRGLFAYNLNTRKQVLNDLYAQPVEVSGDNITYLSRTSVKATSNNCPSLVEYTTGGLGAVIMSKVTVNLVTLVKSDLGQKECIAIQ